MLNEKINLLKSMEDFRILANVKTHERDFKCILKKTRRFLRMNSSRMIFIVAMLFAATCQGQCVIPGDEEIHSPIKVSDNIYVSFGKIQLPKESPL